jgi:hypothetical protein
MKWYALYRDGELLGISQWFGNPGVWDFGVGEMVGARYDIKEIVVDVAWGQLKVDLYL